MCTERQEPRLWTPSAGRRVVGFHEAMYGRAANPATIPIPSGAMGLLVFPSLLIAELPAAVDGMSTSAA